MPRFLRSGVGLGVTASILVTAWTLAGFDGWQYYTTPLGIRGYEPLHPLLRPSGPIGQSFGVVGAALMLVPFLYMVRKRLPRWTWLGSMKTWLEVHLFCGIFGPVLITLHTSFKFNGIISAAYWSMVIVVLSGFIGRYLYVRIPRSIRGVEMSRGELDRRADDLLEGLSRSAGAGPWLARAKAVAGEPGTSAGLAGLFLGEVSLRRRLRALNRALRSSSLTPPQQDTVLHLATERALLLRRGSYLQTTKTAFGLWHVFHVPLVYFLLLIATVHVGVTLYLGYVPFRW